MIFMLVNITLLLFNLTTYLVIDLLLFLDLMVITGILYFHLIHNRESLILSSFIVFNWLFFFVAPLLQIKRIVHSGNFPNTMAFDNSLVVLGFSSVIIFNLLFFSFYLSLQKYFRARILSSNFVKYNRGTFFFILILSISILFIFSSDLLIIF